jgi:hypothetical protein
VRKYFKKWEWLFKRPARYRLKVLPVSSSGFLTVLAPDKAVNSGGLDGLGRKASNEKRATKHDLVFMIHYLWFHGLLFRGS